ncbi:MAG: carbamoyltransferase HypF [Anaerolineales bacterium]|nr:carbamoyltransferase HypF [Anaerolineales bacterium]
MAGRAGQCLQGEYSITVIKAVHIHITGIVQGVGFRPFVYNLAVHHQIKGWVRNTSAGVDIEAEAVPDQLGAFLRDLSAKSPPLSQIDQFTTNEIETQGFGEFSIIHSESDPNAFVPISPDVTVCADCLAEMSDPSDRRYRYPFINCTNCGPRFTIIHDIPYDRPFTTMAGFPLCADCQAEYENPADRRFHAQPVACPQCGPHIWLEDTTGKTLAQKEEAVQLSRAMLKEGKILAIRGLGGFHLACDATNPKAVETLRQRKLRVGKPFAIMYPNLTAVEKDCNLSKGDIALVTSRERPIVILPQKPESQIAPQAAPGQNTLGVILPYTPLHFLIIEPEPGFPTALVMTSGNLSDEPIATTNQEARQKLSTMADAFLLHNRGIYIRCDDSVIRTREDGHQYPLRRSRGYAPNPIRTKWEMPQILAAGAALKNTFCLTKGPYAFLSHHIGDLDNYETLVSFEEGISHYQKLFRLEPECIAYDLHPDYLSTRYAIQRAQSEGLQALGIQHHHAHIAACMVENNTPAETQVIGLSFDGTGYGSDGTIWGGEVLICDYRQFNRAVWLEPVPLPGGDAAIKEPWRIALSWLIKAGIQLDDDLPPIGSIDPQAISLVQNQIEKLINAPLTSSLGRLFDAAAAMIGIRQTVSYEAQAAIEMEALASPAETGCYPFEINKQIINPIPAISSLVEDQRSGIAKEIIAARFHNTIAEIAYQTCLNLREETDLNKAALSGGVWQNMVLLEKTSLKLEQAGFEVLLHRQVPANDGGLSLGQAAIAYHTIIN